MLESIPQLATPPDLTSFENAYDSIIDAEGFLDRLEAARREIPGKLNVLDERIARLNDLNVVFYRRGMANRVRVLVQGMREAIAREEFDSAEFQLAETSTLIGALETDVRARVSSEARELDQRLRAAIEVATDPKLTQQARDRAGTTGGRRPS